MNLNHQFMNRLLSVLSVGLLVASGSFTAAGQVSRETGTSPDARKEVPRGVRLPEGALKMRQPETPASGRGFTEIPAKSRTPKTGLNVKGTPQSLPAVKAQAKASSVQGYCSYISGAYELGWYNISWPEGSTLKWKRQTQVSPGAGFVRGDEVFAFYTLSTTSSGLTDAGYDILDFATGAVKENHPAQIFETLEQVVVLAAYDCDEDMGYVVTFNNTGDSYLLQKFDPKTKSFTNLGVSVPSDWMSLAYNPADKCLYLFDEAGELKRYDSKGKKFARVNTLTWDMTEYKKTMIYSPKDNAFLLSVDSYDDSDNERTDMILLPVTGAHTYLGTVAGNPQYNILYVPDSYVNPAGAKAPTLAAWNVTGGETTGNFEIQLPTQYENGSAISGTVYLQVTVDGNEASGSLSGTPGAKVTVPLTCGEGLHRFMVTPFTLSNDGKVFGTPLVFERCIGVDVPKAPENVTLTAEKVSWEAVTEGANGGYVNTADMKYNVYLDTQLITPTPIAETTLDITLPEGGVVAHVAKVYAVSGGKTSEAGVSEKLYAEGALGLPVYLGLEDGEEDMDPGMIDLFTIVHDPMNTNPNDLRGWRYDDQSEHFGGFYSLVNKESTSTTENNDEWLFLPAINFPDADGRYRLSMDIWTGGHYFSGDEIYEIALCKRPNGSRPTMIKEATTIHKSNWFETSETIFQVPEAGEWYIGIHHISPIADAYRLYVRNFLVTKSQTSADSPAAVTELTAEAGAEGALEAVLTFKMPTTSVTGTELPASTQITATAVAVERKSTGNVTVGEASVTGTPGQAMTMKVPATQGMTFIGVTTSSDKGEGMLAETNVYCGVYAPTTPDVKAKISDDNMTVTFEITPKDYNDNGEYAGAAQQDVTIFRKVNGEWRVAEEIGKQRTWQFTHPEGPQELHAIGIGVKNAAGSCEEMYTFSAHMGPVFQLPMNEPLIPTGDVMNYKYEPLSVEHFSYLQSQWAWTDPTDLDESAANATNAAVVAVYDGESQLVLPRFSTKGLSNVKFDFSSFFGNLSAEKVSIIASSPILEPTEVAAFDATSGSGWEHKLVSLPAGCQDQGWVQLAIRVKIVGYSQCFMMDSYSIANYPQDMMTISGMTGATRGAVGEKLAYAVEIENAGTKDAALPAYTFRVLGDNGIIADLKDADAPAQIKAGEKALLKFSFTPKSADKGDAVVRFNLLGQPVEATAEMDKQLTILNARVPVVDDLAIAYGDTRKDVVLSWSEPRHTEDFEAAEPWSYDEDLRGFRNLDLDKGKVWPVGEFDFPGEGREKAYQVFSQTVTDNATMAARSGEQYLLCMSPKTGTTDDWLISPEVKPGSKFSFWMNICSPDYAETVLVKYSTAGNEPADFKKQFDNGYICPDKVEWKRYEFTLPADAKYFALHHVGDDGNEQFGFMIDDISFEPVKGAATVEGYNIYRDDVLVKAGHSGTTFTDKDVDTSTPVRYLVKTLATVNGEQIESDRSNVVWATDGSGVGDLTGSAPAMISGGKGVVTMRGFAAGTAYSVSNAAGMVMAAGNIGNDTETVALPAGIYIVRCGSAAVKVVVR